MIALSIDFKPELISLCEVIVFVSLGSIEHWLTFPFFTLFLGEKNSCYLPESTLTTYNLAKEAHPHQEYSWIQIPGYGHLDCIFGRNAVYDVYPHILRALDAHSQDLLLRDKNAVLHVLRAVDSLKLEDSGLITKSSTNDNDNSI